MMRIDRIFMTIIDKNQIAERAIPVAQALPSA